MSAESNSMSQSTKMTRDDRVSSLISRNVTIFNHRTSVRLEPEMWNALYDIAEREKCNIHMLCSLISHRKSENSSLTAAIRVFVMLYYKAAATEAGHQKCGHGEFLTMLKRARIDQELMPFFQSAKNKSKWKTGQSQVSNV